MAIDAKQLFEILVRENADMLIAYLRAAVRDAAVADDLFQETMLTAWRRLEDYDRARAFGPWLRGIAAKLILAHYRASVRVAAPHEPAVLEHLGQRLDQIHTLQGDAFNDKLDALRKCVDALPDKYGAAVRMRYHRELGLAEIGEQLQLTAEAVKKRLQRAKARLTDCVERKLAVAEGA
ncbi:RNA polymerase sigma factor SigM [Posidoniimonas polymericola]|uniref:RNA polymerase sigma factor SigM n=1 Tax=Posidoniimonas polymericola TaxID=2528002 RepID=A0A5C5XV16_9BACT|nr:sigma-70 family RNA polymerase sigma factor [Posidoniimonas polymericola]TWT66339.1 RNA polymerase sigma factor SigM [Posidoniimonas polymericola]